jgi:hypothetical protein
MMQFLQELSKRNNDRVKRMKDEREKYFSQREETLAVAEKNYEQYISTINGLRKQLAIAHGTLEGMRQALVDAGGFERTIKTIDAVLAKARDSGSAPPVA